MLYFFPITACQKGEYTRLRRTYLNGYGDCDGGEFGNGEMLIFCYVKNPQKAILTIRETLRKNGFLEGATITY
jgi:hypothetical protein